MSNDLVLDYAAAGIRVHPLNWRRPSGSCSCGRNCGANAAKHPLLRRGSHDASADLDQVRRWLDRWPVANWGMIPPPGTIVVDVDPRNGGDDALAELQRVHSPLPETLTARTGSGGLHYWFAYTGPVRGKLCTGVDLKGPSGYVVAPPSVHISGRPYEWIDPDAVSVPAPTWFRTVLEPPRPAPGSPRSRTPLPHTGRGGLDALVGFIAAAGEGELNSSLYWAAARAVERGLDPAPLVDAAVAKGHPRRGAENTVSSAEKAPPRKGARHR